MNKLLLIVILPLLSACGADHGLSTAHSNEEKGVTHHVTQSDQTATTSKQAIAADAALLYVNGLGCPLCATNIDKQLMRARGVQSATVDLGAGTVLVAFRAGAPRPSPYELSHVVADAGFTLVKVETR